MCRSNLFIKKFPVAPVQVVLFDTACRLVKLGLRDSPFRSQQVRQLGDVDSDATRFVLREQSGSGAAGRLRARNKRMTALARCYRGR